MASNELPLKKSRRKVMSMTLADISDVDFVCNELLRGGPGSPMDEYQRQALEVRRLLEDMKATHANNRLARLALIVATASMLVGALSTVVIALKP